MSKNPIIRLENATKTHTLGSEEVHALDGINFTMEQGSFWAIMGPSGSGKSTTLNILGCLDHLTSGKYFLKEEDISQLNDDELSEIRLSHLGFIFQSFNLIPQLTVQENIELPLYYLNWQPNAYAKRARDLADLVGLADRLNHRPNELSGGQRQRVAIARSLANDPYIILADEPTGNLDSANGEQILQLIIDLNKNGKTIAMVTHDPDIAAHASHQLHIRDGKIDRIECRESKGE